MPFLDSTAPKERTGKYREERGPQEDNQICRMHIGGALPTRPPAPTWSKMALADRFYRKRLMRNHTVLSKTIWGKQNRPCKLEMLFW